jgi:hypothetical protein
MARKQLCEKAGVSPAIIKKTARYTPVLFALKKHFGIGSLLFCTSQEYVYVILISFQTCH